MEMRQMRYFIAVAEELNFTKAAARVFLTQQSLSEQIGKLEQRLGIKLLERNTRSVSLTAAGLNFLQDARQIVRLSDEAVRRAQSSMYTSKLEVSFTMTAMQTVLPRLRQVWCERYPDVDLSLVERCTRDGVQALLDGRADIAFLHMLAQHPKLETFEVQRDPWMLAVSSAHPLAKRSGVHVSDLRDIKLIASPLSEAPRLRQHLHDACFEHGFEPQIVLELQPQTAQLSAVANRRDCAAVVGASLRELAPRGVRLVPLSGLDPLPLHIAVRRNDENALTRAFYGLTLEPSQSIQ